MSRLGRIPIDVPDKVKVNVAGAVVHVEGPAGKLSWAVRPEIKVKIDGGKRVVIERTSNSKLVKSLHGTTRSRIAGMVQGALTGFEKILDISGVGYGAKVAGEKLTLTIGFSHPVEFTVPKGIAVACPTATSISIKGSDKHAVGEFAATVRRARKAEPYNQKGIKYRDEIVRRKAGKTFVTGAS